MNKKCKYCAMEIPSAAKICPYCRKTKGWTLRAKTVGFVIGFIVLGEFMSSFNDHTPTTPTATTAAPSTPAGTSNVIANGVQGRAVPTTDESAAWKTLPASAHIQAAKAVLQRHRESAAYLKAVAAGKEPKMGDPVTKKEWADARTRLNLITSYQPEYKEAQALLKEMDAEDRKAVADESKTQTLALAAARKIFAKDLEQRLVDAGMNVDVTASGPRNESLTIKWALTDKVTANQFSKSGIPTAAESAGFKKMTLTDGYDQYWTWTLHPKQK